jgi:outer membrane protein TolC
MRARGNLFAALRRTTFALAFMLPVVAAGVAFAGEQPKVYTLDQLIAVAIERSPELQAAGQQVDSALYDLAQANAGKWAQFDATVVAAPVPDADRPTVTVSATPNADGTLRGVIDENSGQESLGPFGRLDFTLSQPVFTFGKISYRQEAARHGVAAKQAALDQKRGELIEKVKTMYYGMLVAQQGENAANDVNSFVEDTRKKITTLMELKAQNVDPNDIHRLETYAAGVESFKTKASSGARMARMALQRTVGLPPGEDFKLDRSELPKDAETLPSSQEFIDKALHSRPELEQLKEGLEARRNLVEAAKADLYPSIFLAFIGSFAYAPGRDSFDNDYITDDYNHSTFGAFVGAKWHFDFGIEQARVKKARAEYLELKHTKQYAEQNIPLEVMKCYEDAVEAQGSYQAYAKGAKEGRRWLVSAFSNFDLGVGPARDIFEALDQYGKNQGEYLRALYNYHVAMAKLSRAAGEYRKAGPPRSSEEPFPKSVDSEPPAREIP